MTEQIIITALRDCFDPEIPLNLVELGIVASVALTPAPDAPGSGIPGVPNRFAATVTLLPSLSGESDDEAHDAQLRALVHNRLAGFYELSRISVQTLPSPPWTPAFITAAGRRALNLDQPHFPILNNRVP